MRNLDLITPLIIHAIMIYGFCTHFLFTLAISFIVYLPLWAFIIISTGRFVRKIVKGGAQ